MNFCTIADGVVVFFITVAIITFEALQDLFSIFRDGIFIDQRKVLMKKTNKELRLMLKGIKGISNYKKDQLIECLMYR